MTSYLSAILTNTTSKYASIRRQLLPDDNDGDTEDDTHICRVLRAYYIEKGRPFPQWLPPDPKKAPVAPSYAQEVPTSQRYAGYGQRPAARGGLSDLWDSPGQSQSQQPPQSLRGATRPTAQATSTGPLPGRGERYEAGGPTSQRLQPTGARPLPSQREGSYQSISSQQSSTQESLRPTLTSGSTSTQDRLKARLWGAGGGAGSRSGSPAMGESGRGSFDKRGPS